MRTFFCSVSAQTAPHKVFIKICSLSSGQCRRYSTHYFQEGKVWSQDRPLARLQSQGRGVLTGYLMRLSAEEDEPWQSDRRVRLVKYWERDAMSAWDCTASGNETLCQSGNETLCQSGNETLNQSGNETLCQSGNETLYQSGNETLCQSGNETPHLHLNG